MKPKQLLNRDFVASIGLIAFSLFVMQKAKEFGGAAAKFRGVSPALFPTILSIAIIVLSLPVMIRGLRKGYNWDSTVDFRKRNSYIALGLVLATVLYVLILEFLGFYLATSLYTLALIILMRGASPIRAIIVAFASVGVIYFVFHTLMFVPFPESELLRLLGL